MVPNLETSAGLICMILDDCMILISESFVVFIHCIRIHNYITPYNITICNVYGGLVHHRVMWNHHDSVKYLSGLGRPRNKVKLLVIFFSILLLGVKN